MLVAFDFDGTLSDDEMIVRLGERAGCADEIEAVTERAMRGELSYAESLRERAARLEGLPTADADQAYNGVRLRPGAASLLSDLSAVGTRTAVLTGGFEAGVRRALDRSEATVDRIVANRLPEQNGALTGVVEGPLVEGTKDVALRSLADDLDISLSSVAVVGDGANDRPMLDIAGLAIGFRPKPAVRDHCDVAVTSVNELRDALANADFL